LLDIDHFSTFNDHYGKRRGDKCLQQIAQSLSSNLKRSTDFIARFGGDEFIVILPALMLAKPNSLQNAC